MVLPSQSWRPRSLQARGPAIRYLQKGGICHATSTAAFTLSCRGSCAVTASFALPPLPVTSAPLLLLRTPFVVNNFEMFHIFFAVKKKWTELFALARAYVKFSKKRHSGVSGLFTKPIREQFLVAPMCLFLHSFVFSFGECPLFEQVFGVRLRPFDYEGLFVLSWAILFAVSLL